MGDGTGSGGSSLTSDKSGYRVTSIPTTLSGEDEGTKLSGVSRSPPGSWILREERTCPSARAAPPPGPRAGPGQAGHLDKLSGIFDCRVAPGLCFPLTDVSASRVQGLRREASGPHTACLRHPRAHGKGARGARESSAHGWRSRPAGTPAHGRKPHGFTGLCAPNRGSTVMKSRGRSSPGS